MFGSLFGRSKTKSVSSSTVKNITNLDTTINNIIDTTALAEVSNIQLGALNKTLKGFSIGIRSSNSKISSILENMSDKQENNTEKIYKGLALTSGFLVSYYFFRKKRGIK